MNWPLMVLLALAVVFAVFLSIYLVVELVRGTLRHDYPYVFAIVGAGMLWFGVIAFNVVVYFIAGVSHGNKDGWLPILYLTTGPLVFGAGIGMLWALRRMRTRRRRPQAAAD